MPRSAARPRAYDNLPSERYQGRASFGSEPPSKTKRKEIAEETLSLIPSVLQTMGFSSQPESIFFSSQLEELDRSRLARPGYPTRPSIKVRYGDTFSLARELLKSRPDYSGKVAVLNCASDTELAGGWRHRFGTTQEDALCYSSTIWPTLEKWSGRYPWRTIVSRDGNPGECAGIFHPNVVIFRDELAKDCRVLDRKDWATVSVTSVAALACPPLVPASKSRGGRGDQGQDMQLKLDKDVRRLKERWRMILRMAAAQEKSLLLLAAIGCGVWKCPPRQMAELLKECLEEPEFQGWFEDVWVGIYDRKVCDVWREVLEDGEES
ncbi:hypothetical protein HRR83_003726 [Exophiala dermatitidis]|uniref:Microbial-type PARG catalytic domain-containing protein n=2 Tax=Exophiala dermatitidis TaxID=5970 RepID=H6BTC5_EXODN|nr:uncharacterized protein HMPREF1120_01710 [Exophiala dermatitidis NIH/UT8656]KAJ4518971.1 hypothetical protein HRR75_002647 [Exophiala dermatitidis]EHY53521.1 hypothetical protein HMPREF1120_01710 [Exophiala dermatitidis NIH/UT8656]KAJ4522309.1 hypothetical protein HRR74_002892 [Exophiala dermatitidis]KAJ4529634.1 hypothetical protein HRR73_000660 [Exophiala dermatitidis]KAJ4543202.1 hypothetical protein HRR77_005459 [Exophiala dermatitidis]